MCPVTPVLKREFLGYFRSPVAYVILIAFLVAAASLAFFVGHFFDGAQASLESYFVFHPWLFLLFIPAVGMRLWSEEKRTGTIELLFTLPLTTLQAVLGKFFAAWIFLAVGILLSVVPMAATVGYLGAPDWGIIVSSTIGSLLMAGAYLGVCSLMSALTKNQVISFILGVIVCLVLLFLGWSVFNDILYSFLPVWLADLLANFSFSSHFDAFTRGIIDPKDVIYFLSVAGFALFLNVLVLER